MNQSVSTMTGKVKIKIVLLGNQSVGKSSIIEKYVKDHFDQTSHPTVGIDFLVKNVIHKNKNYRLQLWDTAGQQRFRSLIPNYLKDAKCALIIVDVTNKASLDSAEQWMNLYNDNKTGQGFTFLIGNKIDLEYRQITQEQGKKKAQELGIPYYELSAKTGQNVQQLFFKLIDVSQEHTLSAANFDLDKSGIKNGRSPMNEVKQQQDQTEQKQNKKTKQAAPSKNQQGQQTKIVLKSQKINQQTKKKKNNQGCC